MDDFDAEQQHLERAYAQLARMRAHTLALLAEVGRGDEEDDLRHHLQRRVWLLREEARPLCFGRIDTDTGDTWHIGRRHVEDERSDPVVVEWRAPVAVPFYQATVEEPLGIRRRRQFVVDGSKLLQYADDHFGPGAAGDDTPHIRGKDALLAELERSRTGQMVDIVATIQADQDRVIRAPKAGIVAVQGGPGTGKTAIGLHRAAFLLFGDDLLARDGVLVIGPNRTFLRYISQVLPALGEDAVVQTTLADLVAGIRVRGDDTPEAAHVKGDRRMATVLCRALHRRRRPLEAPIEVPYGVRRFTLAAGDANDLAENIAGRPMPYHVARTGLAEALSRQLLQVALDRLGQGADVGAVRSAIRAAPSFRKALDTLWPPVSAAALVREVVTKRAVLADAAAGVLAEPEQRAILRKPSRKLDDEPWTEADIALLDEAGELLDGRIRSYGHVVVDEAQDLSPMQVRMLGRRCPAGSYTILGDLAQGTGVWARERWSDLVADLPQPDGVRYEELRTGYRAPGRVLDLASRLLPAAAPGVPATRSIREGRWHPVVRRVDADVLAERATEEAKRLQAIHASVAVLVPASLSEALRHLSVVDGGSLERPVVVLPAASARGLEFDAVVVVEPAGIVAELPPTAGIQRGLRSLYIALTRPTQHLTILHAGELPPELAAALPAAATR